MTGGTITLTIVLCRAEYHRTCDMTLLMLICKVGINIELHGWARPLSSCLHIGFFSSTIPLMTKDAKEKVTFRTDDRPYAIPLLFVVFLAIFFISFALGRYPVDPITLTKILLSRIFDIEQDWARQAETVVFNIRLPRVLIGALIGAGLSLSGLVYQGIFQNPMVSPDVLGCTSGAGVGSALGLLWAMGYFTISFMSFAGGLIAVGLVVLIASRVKSQPVLGLVLAGIMISSLFNSILSFIKLVADTDDVLPQITYYLIGSLTSTRQSDLVACAIVITASALVLFAIRWPLNVMTLGEEEAVSLGVNTRAIRLVAIICATLMTAVSTAAAGMIGWIGLVIPHLVRMILGCDYRKTIPATILMGSAFLMLVDTVSRTLTTSEIPIGILTSFIGAPFFLYLIIREGKKT